MRRIFDLLRMLAKFSFASGRDYVIFPDGSRHRAAEKAHVVAKRERKERAAKIRKEAQKSSLKKEGKNAERNHWEKSLRAMPRFDREG